MGKRLKPLRKNTLRFLVWYTEHIENEVFLLFVGVAFLVGYVIYIMISLEFPWSWIVPIALVAFLYFYMKRLVKRKLYHMIREASKQFSTMPSFKSKTTEGLIEAIDLEILMAIKENGGDYFEFIPDLASIFDPYDIVAGLGKLTSLGKLVTYSNKIALTAEGMEILSMPPTSLRHVVPAEVAKKVASAKASLKSGNFNGVVDEVNKLFECVLRDAFVKHRDDYEKEWNRLRKEQKVKRDLSKVGLGELLTACREVGILRQGDLFENLILAFLKIRTPEKHNTERVVVPEASAQTALSLAESFLRHWYQ